MKILAFADTHGDMSALERIREDVKKKDVDLVICAGDFTFFEQHIEIMIKKLSELGTDVLLIHGNHEYDEVVEVICKKYKNIYFMHNKMKRIGKYVFIGHGGGGFYLRDSEFVNEMDKISKKIEKNDEIILLTHAPPFGTKIDAVPPYGHVGNKDYREFIEKNNIILAVSGHIHEGFGKEDKIGKAKVISPGFKGKIVELE
ncbi:metallophosphoesterase [Candidatus Woesearchaeota archaeon]|nr:metallophosphoesterase [Candidatus Woesearchaeota archaeon]